ncbi:glycosyltransferase family 20-domain-containing protein [Cokeromyces recurvatus]|uniref:glycosyltransferase family 20-domain-containing protein n=1 Tax=Cokeromyces recurvatus TaxID=90255 RepID=UPI00221F894B|nr:glycosyltransferase family 20-domain-containing protein [Cokeromyces recurvatus]KAI7904460.1 glycosyltransferase family 20-domain-containing protein [Cokeromyces recurvatus]
MIKNDLKIKTRIIHVTHQIPFEISREFGHWKLTNRQGHSAMYGGIKSLDDKWETICIGWTGKIVEKRMDTEMESVNTSEVDPSSVSKADKETIKRRSLERGRCIPLFLNNESSAGHYYGYCKKLLWPLFNYIIWNDATDGRIEKSQWNFYKKVNQRYADLVIAEYQPTDTIWVHDYHLLLVPSMIRASLPRARIGLFVHSSFPSSEIFRCLPKRQEILKGMLGANLVGFQTYAHARHFISTCTRILGYESSPEGVEYEGHFCYVGTFPIGIDVDAVDRIRNSPDVLPKIKAIADMYPDKKIIVSRDKMDLVQGILQKLAAFEKFLINYPDWRNKVVLIQTTDMMTTTSVSDMDKVAERVDHINGAYGSLEHLPIYHYHHPIHTDEYYALLSTADLALITAVRDGMNTTSLDYIMCQQKKHGPLIVSELTGTAGSMSSALLVNPWDHTSVARAIHDALTMSDDEKLTRHKQLLQHVKSNTTSFWAHSFIKMLLHTYQLSEQNKYTPKLKLEQLQEHYLGAKKRLLCFDYDGTLTEIKNTPMAAVPSKTMLTYLKQLCKDPKNEVWIISGRDEGTLSNWLGDIDELGLSAEHGSFMRFPGSKRWINLIEHLDMNWKNDVLEIFTYYTERTMGSFIEHKRCAITWHYRLADPVYGAFQAKECQNHLEQAILSKLPIDILVGKKNLEVRPKIVNKGEILKRLLASTMNSYDFVMCCGDDRTDEDMFKVLKKAELPDCLQKFSVLISAEDKKTEALWHLPTVQDMIESMKIMSECSLFML